MLSQLFAVCMGHLFVNYFPIWPHLMHLITLEDSASHVGNAQAPEARRSWPWLLCASLPHRHTHPATEPGPASAQRLGPEERAFPLQEGSLAVTTEQRLCPVSPLGPTENTES